MSKHGGDSQVYRRAPVCNLRILFLPREVEKWPVAPFIAIVCCSLKRVSHRTALHATNSERLQSANKALAYIFISDIFRAQNAEVVTSSVRSHLHQPRKASDPMKCWRELVTRMSSRKARPHFNTIGGRWTCRVEFSEKG